MTLMFGMLMGILEITQRLLQGVLLHQGPACKRLLHQQCRRELESRMSSSCPHCLERDSVLSPASVV